MRNKMYDDDDDDDDDDANDLSTNRQDSRLKLIDDCLE